MNPQHEAKIERLTARANGALAALFDEIGKALAAADLVASRPSEHIIGHAVEDIDAGMMANYDPATGRLSRASVGPKFKLGQKVLLTHRLSASAVWSWPPIETGTIGRIVSDKPSISGQWEVLFPITSVSPEGNRRSVMEVWLQPWQEPAPAPASPRPEREFKIGDIITLRSRLPHVHDAVRKENYESIPAETIGIVWGIPPHVTQFAVRFFGYAGHDCYNLVPTKDGRLVAARKMALADPALVKNLLTPRMGRK